MSEVMHIGAELRSSGHNLEWVMMGYAGRYGDEWWDVSGWGNNFAFDNARGLDKPVSLIEPGCRIEQALVGLDFHAQTMTAGIETSMQRVLLSGALQTVGKTTTPDGAIIFGALPVSPSDPRGLLWLLQAVRSPTPPRHVASIRFYLFRSQSDNSYPDILVQHPAAQLVLPDFDRRDAAIKLLDDKEALAKDAWEFE